jgi:hypothetical protein
MASLLVSRPDGSPPSTINCTGPNTKDKKHTHTLLNIPFQSREHRSPPSVRRLSCGCTYVGEVAVLVSQAVGEREPAQLPVLPQCALRDQRLHRPVARLPVLTPQRRAEQPVPPRALHLEPLHVSIIMTDAVAGQTCLCRCMPTT